MARLGFDFGTSHTLAGVIKDGALQLVRFFNGEYSAPTVLYFPAKPDRQKTYFVGRQAIEEYLEADRKHRGRLIFAIKPLLGDPSFTSTTVPGFGDMTAVKLCGMFMKKVKELAELQLGETFDSVVLGRPVDFSPEAVEDLYQAALFAGFTHVTFQLEPIAAGLAFEKSKACSKPVRALVFDAGGGTTDFAVIELKPGQGTRDRTQDVLAQGGVNKAGNAFSSAMVGMPVIMEKFGQGAKWTSMGKINDIPNELLLALGDWRKLQRINLGRYTQVFNQVEAARKTDLQRLFDLITRGLGYAFYNAVNTTKEQLSKADKASVEFPELSLSAQVTRTEFENSIGNILREYEQEILATLARAGEKLGVNFLPSDIDVVIMTGGTSLVPAVQNLAARMFGREKLVQASPFDSVVGGLALQASQQS